MPIANRALKDFFESAKRKKYAAGELVLRGEDPSGVVLIKEGFVSVYSISDEGSRYIHIIYQPGELFPLIWALRNLRRRVFYEAVSDVAVYEVPRDDFLNHIRQDPASLREVLDKLAEQFYVFADRLDNLQYESAHEKVAYRLMFLASRFGERDGGSVIIKAPLTHDLISASINLARETVSREIESLEKADVISRRSGFIVINDVASLSREFSEPITLDLWGLQRHNDTKL
jgi:CRP-like cAMP-binding protein